MSQAYVHTQYPACMQVSRKHPEQCDAESLLLRAGAHDISPRDIPLLLGSEDDWD